MIAPNWKLSEIQEVKRIKLFKQIRLKKAEPQ